MAYFSDLNDFKDSLKSGISASLDGYPYALKSSYHRSQNEAIYVIQYASSSIADIENNIHFVAVDNTQDAENKVSIGTVHPNFTIPFCEHEIPPNGKSYIYPEIIHNTGSKGTSQESDCLQMMSSLLNTA